MDGNNNGGGDYFSIEVTIPIHNPLLPKIEQGRILSTGKEIIDSARRQRSPLSCLVVEDRVVER